MKNLFKRIIYGVVIAEFIMQTFFLILSINLGELVYAVYPSGKGVLHDFITQFITFTVLGLVFGIIRHIYVEKMEKISSGKAQLRFIICIFLSVLLAIMIIYGVRAVIEGIASIGSIIIKDGIVLVILGGLFCIAYLIASPILDKIDKECVEQINKKLNERK